LFLLLAPIWAGAVELSEAIAGIENRYNRSRSMQLLFEQTYTGHGRPPRTESGALFLRKPRRMRWDYREPAGKLFLADGKNVYFYSPAARRVEKTPLKESGDLRAPLAFLIGRLDLRRDFATFRSKPEGDHLHITALPKSKKAPYTEVEFVVAPDFRIERLVVQGQDNSTMEFRFSGEKPNPALAEELFTFQMPEGAELVEIADEEEGGN
jgi:outer membrane lipoprotein carrier protein